MALKTWFVPAALLAASFAQAVVAQGVTECGNVGAWDPLRGPWDYRDPALSERIGDANHGHFNEDVQNLRQGQSATGVMPDLDYVLARFPNHYPALDAVGRYQLSGGDFGQFRGAECYFDRAVAFRPDDGMVRMVYAIYLARKGDLESALERYQEALVRMPDSAEVHYNIALLYIEMEDYMAANQHAREAYALGYPLPGLRNKLVRLGKWQEKEVGLLDDSRSPEE